MQGLSTRESWHPILIAMGSLWRILSREVPVSGLCLKIKAFFFIVTLGTGTEGEARKVQGVFRHLSKEWWRMEHRQQLI